MQGSPGKYQKTLYHGQAFESAPFSLLQEDGTAVDLSGATISAALRSNNGRYPMQVSVSPGDAVFKFSLTQEAVLAIPTGTYLFDLVIENILPLDLVWLRGEWKIVRGAAFGN